MQAQHKRCTKCGVEKPVDDFYHRGGRPIAACKDCTKQARREYVAAHREDVKAALRAWHRANREQANATSRAYRAANLEAQRAKKRAHYAANREAINERHRTVYLPMRAAVRNGDLVPEPCLFCDATEVEAHHHDYSLPLDVTWLCVRHHRLAHEIVG